MRIGIGVLGVLVVWAALVPPGFCQGGTTPTQPQDPTARTPSTPPQSTPPTVPPPESQPKAPNSPGRPLVRVIQPFTGTVVAQKNGYVLRTGDLEHRLDARPRASRYVGQKVRITGSLDKANNTIHIQTIEEISDQVE